jgi:hypothetical protein
MSHHLPFADSSCCATHASESHNASRPETWQVFCAHVTRRGCVIKLSPVALFAANIFLTLTGTVKVGDLGLGRLLSDKTVEAHSKVGTPLVRAAGDDKCAYRVEQQATLLHSLRM